MIAPKSLLLLTIISSLALAEKLPSFLKTCKLRTPDFLKCALKSGNEAIPYIMKGDRFFGIPSFDPLVLPSVKFQSGSLRMDTYNVTVKGIPSVKMTYMAVDEENQTVALNTYNKMVAMEFDYAIGGKIASLAIEGKGNGTLIIYDTDFDYLVQFNITKRDGLDYADLYNGQLDVKPKNVFIKLDNLFEGNQALSDRMNEFLNENWRDLLKELNPFISEVVGAIVDKIIYKLFKTVPINEIFPDYS